MISRITRVRAEINSNLLTIATNTAERKINHTPGREKTVRTSPTRAMTMANI